MKKKLWNKKVRLILLIIICSMTVITIGANYCVEQTTDTWVYSEVNAIPFLCVVKSSRAFRSLCISSYLALAEKKECLCY